LSHGYNGYKDGEKALIPDPANNLPSTKGRRQMLNAVIECLAKNRYVLLHRNSDVPAQLGLKAVALA